MNLILFWSIFFYLVDIHCNLCNLLQFIPMTSLYYISWQIYFLCSFLQCQDVWFTEWLYHSWCYSWLFFFLKFLASLECSILVMGLIEAYFIGFIHSQHFPLHKCKIIMFHWIVSFCRCLPKLVAVIPEIAMNYSTT